MIKRPIQILYCFSDDLSIYFGRYQQGALELPEFSSCCPLCGARDCPTFLGYYRRAVVLENGELIQNFPIARYNCRRRGTRAHRHPHVTFSLLPHQLVPYSRISLPYLQELIEIYRGLGSDFEAFLRERGPLAISCLYWGLALLVRAYAKLKATRRSWPHLRLPPTASRPDLLGKFWLQLWRFSYGVQGQLLKGLAALGLKFYHEGGGWRLEAHFLWGTPSQFR